jgi:F-type H+-transporting ATPase subunit a
MIFSPIEQFEIFEFIIDAICLRSKFSISLSNYSLTILCFSGLLLLLGISFFLINAKVPTRAQLAYYRYLSIVRGIIQDLLSPQVAKIYFFTLVLFVFFFINFLNLMGLIPYTIAITAQFSVTFLIAFLFFLTINLTGLYYHGFDMLRLFHPQGTPLAILPLLVIIEIISYFA